MYGHDKVLFVLDQICRMTLPASIITAINKHIEFHEVKNGDSLRLGDLHLQCFDIASTKEKQYGFRALLPDGQSLVCLGDEPYNDQNRTYVEGADWLLCEAFCLIIRKIRRWIPAKRIIRKKLLRSFREPYMFPKTWRKYFSDIADIAKLNRMGGLLSS